METWKPIQGYEGYYEISNYGNVRSVTRQVKASRGENKFRTIKGTLKPTQQRAGSKYRIVTLCKENKLKTFQVHQLVMMHFYPNFVKGTQINHKDGNPENNHIDNLEPSNASHNQLHAIGTGLKPKVGKTSKYYRVSYIAKYDVYAVCMKHNGKSSFGWKTFKDELEAAKYADELLDMIGDTVRPRNFPNVP